MTYQRPNAFRLTAVVALLFAIGCIQGFAQSSGGGYTIRKSAVAGGGGTSADSNTQIAGTAGQSAARTVSDGTNTTSGGFWFGGVCNFTAPGGAITPAVLSNAVVGQSYSQLLTGNGSIGPYLFSVTSGALPNGLNLDASGSISGTPTTSGTATFSVLATDSSGCTAAQSFTLTVNCPTITLSALPDGVAGSAYSATVTASPAGGNYSLTLTGTLPPGVSFNNGVFSGTPTVAGNYNFTVTATGFGGCTGSQAYTLTVACPAIVLSPLTLTNGQIGATYSQLLTALPAGGNYGFLLTSGSLPAGLSLSAAGLLSGTPTNSGTFNFRVTATGFAGCTGFQDYQLTIGCATVTVNPTSLSGGTIGTAYSQSVSASPAGSYSYSVTSGALPTGLMLNAAGGTLTGTPTTPGTFSFTVTATAGVCAGSRGYTVTIGCAGIAFTTTSPLTAGQAGTTYSQTLVVAPAASPGSYSFSLTTGSLPAGLTLNAITGVISGTPGATGSFSFTVKAQTANGCNATQSYTLVIGCPAISLSPTGLPNGATGTAYNQSLSASPAGGNYVYAVSAGSLPTGLNLNSATGVLSGTPSVQAAFNFTVTATGFGACSGSRAYGITIGTGGCPTVTLPTSLPRGSVGGLYSNSVAALPAGSYSYTSAGTLPPGVTLYGAFGLLLGYPTANGTYNFSVTATGANDCSATQSYSVVIGAGNALAKINDFSGDGRSDFALWREAQTQWLIVDGATGAAQIAQWGRAGDSAVTGDFDADGKADLAGFGKDGHWRLKLSGGGTVDKLWGLGSDVPVPGDYDGDGKTDLAVWRGADTNWHIQRSSDGRTQTVSWGSSLPPYNDLPVPGDYDGDGKTDIAVFRQASEKEGEKEGGKDGGHWYIRRSSDGTVLTKAWGLGTDVPVPADYDGDGLTDIAVWRGSEGNWYIINSSDGAVEVKFWGAGYAPYFDVPAVGDYDGDGKADAAVRRKPDNRWYLLQSSDGARRTVFSSP